MLDNNLTLMGVSPPPLWLPDAITPEQVLRHHRSAQGWYGGTGTVPSVIIPALLISLPEKRNSPEPFFSARSGTVFKVADPAGDGPEHGHGFFSLVEVPALRKNPVIFL